MEFGNNAATGLLGGIGMALMGGKNYGNDFNKMSDLEHQYYDPYRQQGQSAYDIMRGQYDPMATDPNAYLDKLMEGYKPSQAYQQRREETLGAMGNTAAAGGIRGTQQDQLAQGRMADRLMNEDMQQYLSNVMGIQGRGLQGQQGFYQTGYDATRNLEQGLSNILGTKTSMNFQQNRQQMELLSNLLKALATSGAGV